MKSYKDKIGFPIGEQFLGKRPVETEFHAPGPAGATLLQQHALEYVELKAVQERVESRMKNLRKLIEPELVKMPDRQVAVGNEFLALIFCEKESFDLEAAKKKLDKKKLNPFITRIEQFDLKAAKKHLELQKLLPFIDVKEYFQLRLRRGSSDGSDEE